MKNHHYTKVSECTVNIEDAKITVLTEYANTEVDPYVGPYFKIRHIHSGYELFYTGDSSTMEIEVENRKNFADKNTIAIVSPKVYHRLTKNNVISETRSEGASAIIFSLTSNNINTPYSLYRILSDILSEDFTIINNISGIGEYLDGIEKNLIHPDYPKLHYNVYHLFMKIIKQAYIENPEKAIAETPPSSDSDMSRIHKIYSYIETHLSSNINLEEIANVLNLSTRQTGRIIKDYYGMNWNEFITQKRIEQAIELMHEDALSMEEIIARVGYASDKGFYKAFEKITGCTPAKYRKVFAGIKR